MTKDKINSEVQKLINEISDLSNDDSPRRLSLKCEKINSLLNELVKIAKEEERSEIVQICSDFNHTLGKELEETKYKYQNSIKNNSPKVRMTEYYDSMFETIRQIKIDLISFNEYDIS